MTARSSASRQPERPKGSKSRSLLWRRLKPEAVQEYVGWHKQVWPELLEAYRKAGITQVNCYLYGVDLVVFVEFETEIYANEKERLSQDPVEIRWQALMKSFDDPGFAPRTFEEVFSLPPAPEEKSV